MPDSGMLCIKWVYILRAKWEERKLLSLPHFFLRDKKIKLNADIESAISWMFEQWK